MSVVEPFDLVVHHADCPDGVCAAWVVSKHSPSAQVLAAKYGDAPPDCRGLRVLVVDFSYPREQLVQMHEDAAELFVLDHHKSAAKALEGLAYCVFDMRRSGAGLAWDVLFPGQARPWVVSYVEDRDLWKWALPDSREVNAAFQSYPLRADTFEVFGDLHGPPREMVVEGRAILRYQRRLVEEAVERARLVEVGGHVVPCVESTVLQGEVGETLSAGRSFAAVWSENDQGERVYSLRSREGGLDVSEVAAEFGGGGHPRAAGFRVRR